MRYIEIARLKEGMILAKPFYGSKFEILLGEGMTLGEIHLRRIRELGYAGVYIDDELSAGVEPKDVIPPDLRIRTIKAAKEILQSAESAGARPAMQVSKERQNKIIMPVMDALIANQSRIVDLVDLKPFGDYTYYHAANVVVLSLIVGVELGISGTRLFELGVAALLHDVGNAFVPKELLDKPGKLTESEYEQTRAHCQRGFDFLREQFDISIEACMGALQHHENFDGSGYPNGLRREKISIYGRIIALTDVYDALTSRRPFRQPVSPPAAMDFIKSNAGTRFDPEILSAFEGALALYPSGSCVELDNGAHCLVERNFPHDAARPRLRLLGSDPRTPPILDLHSEAMLRNVNVVGMIDC